MLTEAEYEKRFTFHPVKGDQGDRYQRLRAAYGELAKLVDELAPDSREKSVALTELETSNFWANAAIARNE